MKTTIALFIFLLCSLGWSQKADSVLDADLTHTKTIEIKIYPNPAKDRVYFQSKNELRNLEVRFYDILGKVIKEEKITSFSLTNGMDVSNLPRGVYLVKIDDGQDVYTQKMIKS